MFSRTLVWEGPLVNGKQPNVPCPPATNGIILQARPVDTPAAHYVRLLKSTPAFCDRGRACDGVLCPCNPATPVQV